MAALSAISGDLPIPAAVFFSFASSFPHSKTFLRNRIRVKNNYLFFFFFFTLHHDVNEVFFNLNSFLYCDSQTICGIEMREM